MAAHIDSMAFSGETPWHGLGNSIPSVVEGESPEEYMNRWIKAAGLEWSVSKVATYRPISADTLDKRGVGESNLEWIERIQSGLVIPNQYALERSDNGNVFKVVTERYQTVQPRQIAEFFRDLSESHNMHLETLGGLMGGAVIWGLATNDKEMNVKGDKVKPYTLLSTSYDGTQGTRGSFTSIRVVCMNTLRMSYGQDVASFNVRHSTTFDATQAKINMGLFAEESDAFERAANLLAERAVNEKEVMAVLESLFGKYKTPDSPTDTPVLTKQSQAVIGEVFSTVATSPGSDMDSARGTAWGLLNGVTNYVDHKARNRSTDARLSSAWFGKGDELKADAFAKVREMVPALAAASAEGWLPGIPRRAPLPRLPGARGPSTGATVKLV